MHNSLVMRGGKRVGKRTGNRDNLLDGDYARADQLESGCPSTSSIVRKWTPFASSTEKIVTMCG
jgi:hypothetical protein